MVNTINNGDCVVEVEFDVGTKSIKYEEVSNQIYLRYFVMVNIKSRRSTIDYQKYLETNIMKLNYRSFIQVVLLGSSSYEPFMKMKPRYRREVVEEILDIRVFGPNGLNFAFPTERPSKKVDGGEAPMRVNKDQV